MTNPLNIEKGSKIINFSSSIFPSIFPTFLQCLEIPLMKAPLSGLFEQQTGRYLHVCIPICCNSLWITLSWTSIACCQANSVGSLLSTINFFLFKTSWCSYLNDPWMRILAMSPTQGNPNGFQGVSDECLL